MNVVPLHSGPHLNDLPAQLRHMADQIEAGEISATSMLAIVPQNDTLPAIWLWGENDGPYSDIGLLELAKQSIARRFADDPG